MIYVFGFLNY